MKCTIIGKTLTLKAVRASDSVVIRELIRCFTPARVPFKQPAPYRSIEFEVCPAEPVAETPEPDEGLTHLTPEDPNDPNQYETDQGEPPCPTPAPASSPPPSPTPPPSNPTPSPDPTSPTGNTPDSPAPTSSSSE